MTSASGMGPAEQLRFKLTGLEHEVARSKVLVRRLAWLAIVLLVLLVLLMIALHLYRVMQYALLSEVDALPVAAQPGAVAITYTPSSSGKVEFVRKSDEIEETLTDYAVDPGSSDASKQRFNWSGARNDRYDLQVTYREGLSLVTKPLLKSGRAP